MRVAVLTREYPPYVYGGAGVHVEQLVGQLRLLPDVAVDVHCVGPRREGAFAYGEDDPRMPDANAALRVLSADLHLASAVGGADLLHTHTWYANLAGVVGGLLHGVPHVMTTHSLEPMRPWKREQLGGGYRLSSWAERTAIESAAAIIAVSQGMREDVLSCYPFLDPARVHVVHNGVDTEFFHPVPPGDLLRELGVDPSRPSVVFLGRITRQKGVPHLLRAATRIDPAAQLVLLVGAPDTPELAQETGELVERLRATREDVVYVERSVSREEVRAALGAASVFVCPSIYEPLGIVNLEAMACGTPVVASAVGGIPEVVAHGVTGLLVPYDSHDSDAFEAGLADGVNELLADPERAGAFGAAGRRRAVEEFSWPRIARRTVEVYESALARPR